MENHKTIGWPDIQAYMNLEGFKDNSTLITPNYSMKIWSSTYLVDKKWYDSLRFIKC